jgi:hypothetical protein
MRAAKVSEKLRLILQANGSAYAEGEDGTRYRAQRESDVEVKIRRFRPAREGHHEAGAAEEIDFEPGEVEWHAG